MLAYFEKHIAQTLNLQPHHKILLAVSGGIDSVCMAHLFSQMGYKSSIAHCNFKLRGNESDADEVFVTNLAQELEMPIFTKNFDTAEYATLQKTSIQIAARELRYNWFENLRRIHGFDFIATAHNADDSIETFFINLIRGCGINGITGIKKINGHLVRPLLFAHRVQIEEYCQQHNIQWRTDASNETDKYLRNRIRHHVLPLLEQESTDFRKTMLENLNRFNEAANIYKSATENIIEKIIDRNDADYTKINIGQLLENPSPATILYEILKNYGFSPKTSDEIFDTLNAESGKNFFSDTHRLIKDRELLIICPIEIEEEARYYIEENTNHIDEPLNLDFELIQNIDFRIPANKNIAALDANKLSFPLLLRKWQHGDYFHPLGMDGMKKLSDFFIDNKLSLLEKERCWLLTSGGEIVWVVGHRVDDRFKITENTRNVYLVKI